MKHLFFLLFILITGICFGQQTITFQVKDFPDGTTKIGIRGNTAPLRWEKSIFLEQKDGVFQTSLKFSEGISLLEYKYVLDEGGDNVTWELDGKDNRLGILQASTKKVFKDQWDRDPVYDVSKLPTVTPDALQEDVRILGEALWKLHPGVLKYNDSTSYFLNLNELRLKFLNPKTFAEAYKDISQFVATIQCGHTYANPFNQSGLIKTILLNQKDKLPFGLKWIDGRLFITKNATEIVELKAGTEILHINGMPVSQLANHLLNITKGDGANKPKRFNDLQVIGYDYYESFDVYFPLFVAPEEGKFRLEVKTPDGTAPQLLEVAAIDRNTRYSILSKRYVLPTSIEETWSFDVLDGGIGYLKLGTFTIWNFEMDWKAFLKNAFGVFKAKKVTNLIVDVRENEGGADEVIDELRKYLLKEDCTPRTSFTEKVRYQKVPQELQPYLSTWDNSLFDFGEKVKPCGQGMYCWTNPEKPITHKAAKKPFSGKTYFLINAANSSATFYLAKLVKDCGVGTLIGETTGGTQKGINGGNILFLRLPNSKIEVDIPVYGQFNANAPDEGIRPDIPLTLRPEELQEERDVILDKAIEEIKKR